jgi:CRISPR type I-F-associated protein Csy2
VKAFRLTRNPVGKDGSTAAIVEEGRIHLELSLAFAIRSERWNREPEARDAAPWPNCWQACASLAARCCPRRNRDGFAIAPGAST